ncbi:MAG: ABC transporter permease subunit [Bacteroidetes bacterium]|nr:ABC transporter permease subunit [Bacteroidota bacterium]
MWLTVLRLEIYKIFARPRSYIAFGAIGVIAAIIHFAMYSDGRNYIEMFTQTLEQSFVIEGNILNGNTICFIILQMLIVHVPLLISLVTGDLMSGESDSGTLRLMMLKPVSRLSILTAKFTAGQIYILAVLLFFAFVSLIVGRLIFGVGDLIVLKTEEITVLQAGDITWRFIAALGVAFVALSMVAAISFALSCFANNSIAPIIITMAFIILSTIIAALDLPSLKFMHPYLFTTHMASWRLLFDSPVPMPDLYNSLAILLFYILLSFSIGAAHFLKKDILV